MSGIVVQDMGLVVSGSPRFATKTVTFTGAAGLGLAATNVSIFKVTGQVFVDFISAYCVAGLTEAAATAVMCLGVVNAANLFVLNTNSVDIDTGEFWVSTTPTPAGIALPAALSRILIAADVIVYPGTQNTNGGQMRFDCLWRPLSPDGTLVAA